MSKPIRAFYVIACLVVVLLLTIWLAGLVMRTLDDLRSSWFQMIYAGLVALLLAAFGIAVRQYLWIGSRSSSEKLDVIAASRRQSLETRSATLAAQHGLDESRPVGTRDTASNSQIPTKLSKRPDDASIKLAVLGVKGVGKSSLIRALESVLPETAAFPVVLREAPALGPDRDRNAGVLASLDRGEGAIFVVEQDLRDYEFDALQRLYGRRTGEFQLIVLNKADRLSATARAETLATIRRRVSDFLDPARVVEAQAEPAPVTRITTDSSGIGQETQLGRPPDIKQVSSSIIHFLLN